MKMITLRRRLTMSKATKRVVQVRMKITMRRMKTLKKKSQRRAPLTSKRRKQLLLELMMRRSHLVRRREERRERRHHPTPRARKGKRHLIQQQLLRGLKMQANTWMKKRCSMWQNIALLEWQRI